MAPPPRSALGAPSGSSTEVSESPVHSLLAAMPKAEIHLHLDGCLRLDTIAQLAEEKGTPLPVPLERLGEICVGPERCRDLVQYLEYYVVPLSVLQTPPALERVTYELCEDVRRENVRYVEIRFGPSLHTKGGATLLEIIGAVTRGWKEGSRRFGLAGGIILCGLRNLPPEETMRVAREGLPFLGDGVVGFDLAGDEANFSILLHREALLFARESGYGMTAHAGEAAGPESVRDAIDVIGVSRVGHGVRSGEDPTLLATLRDRGIVLEMCPSSNLQTNAVPTLADHPIGHFYRFGIPVTINTDGRTVSDTTMTKEMSLSHDDVGLSVGDLAQMSLNAVEAGFAQGSVRRSLLQDFKKEMADLGIRMNMK